MCVSFFAFSQNHYGFLLLYQIISAVHFHEVAKLVVIHALSCLVPGSLQHHHALDLEKRTGDIAAGNSVTVAFFPRNSPGATKIRTVHDAIHHRTSQHDGYPLLEKLPQAVDMSQFGFNNPLVAHVARPERDKEHNTAVRIMGIVEERFRRHCGTDKNRLDSFAKMWTIRQTSRVDIRNAPGSMAVYSQLAVEVPHKEFLGACESLASFILDFVNMGAIHKLVPEYQKSST